MEWTKIKPKYFLKPLSQMTLLEHGALARLLTLTAYLERIPTKKEMIGQVPESVLKSLQSTSESGSKGLAGILEKVLEDVARCHHQKAISRSTSKTYREKHNTVNKASDTSRDTTEVEREVEVDKNKDSAKPIIIKEQKPTDIDLSDIVLFDFGEPAKHKIFNQMIHIFKIRGWPVDPAFIKSVYKQVAFKMNGIKPENPYPYFQKSLSKYLNEHSEEISRAARVYA